MKKSFTILVMLVAMNVHGQWVLLNPCGTGVDFATIGTNLFTLSSDGVRVSTNNGTSWSIVNNGLPSCAGASALAVIGTNLFVGICGEGVYLSTNYGNNWTAVNFGLNRI
jgi:hypothetical protein